MKKENARCRRCRRACWRHPPWRRWNRKWRRNTGSLAGKPWNAACNNSPNRPASFSPLRQSKRRPLTLRTELGVIQLTTDYGQDPAPRQWFCPQQRAWGLRPHQKITPRLAEKLCFTTLATRSYEQAAAVAERWGVAVADTVIHQQVQRAGERADQQAEARRRGLGQVPQVFVVADGGVWIWNIVADRFATATGVLDFYHASQHLWTVAHTLHPKDDAEAKAWVEPLLHQLRQGGEAKVWQTLHDLPAWCAQRAQPLPPSVPTEIQYFENHRDHLHYAARAAAGCPVGSGAMESFCAQLQGRFKQCGQFWSEHGRRRLLALELARRNHDWSQVWQQN